MHPLDHFPLSTLFESRIEIAHPAHSNSWQRQNSNPPSRSTARYSISPGVCLVRTRSRPNDHVVSSTYKTPSPSPATAPAMTHSMTPRPRKPHPPPQPRHSISIAGHPRSRPAYIYTSHIPYLPALFVLHSRLDSHRPRFYSARRAIGDTSVMMCAQRTSKRRSRIRI